MAQELYELPEGWEWKSLGEIFEIARGGSPRPIKQYMTDAEDGINWIKIGDATNSSKYIYETKEKIKPEGLKKSRLVKDGDFILSNSMSFGRPYIMRTTGCIHDGWLLLKPNSDQTSEDYVYHLLGSPYCHKQFDNAASGTTVRNLNSDLVRKVQIPVPPLAEQKRIVAQLDALFSRIDQTIAQLQDTQAQTKALWASALDAAFELQVSSSSVAEISESIQYGHTAKAIDKGNAGFLRITDIQNNNVNWDAVPKVKVSEKDLSKYQLNSGDIVFARSGATSGKSFLIREAPTSTIFASYLIRVSPNTLVIHPEFLYLYFQSPKYWDQVSANVAGAAQPNINGKKLGQFRVPLPPLPEQEKIVAQLDAIAERTQALEATTATQLEQLQALKASLLDAAFRGQL